jgi:hypothetical protein
MPEVTFGNTTIEYAVTRSDRRKTISLVVDPSEGVVVIAPQNLKAKALHEVVRNKVSWILEKQALIDEIEEPPKEKEYLSGEKFPYLGRHYRLKVIRSEDVEEPHAALYHGKFLVAISERDYALRREEVVRSALREWYIEHAGERIPERVERYAPKLGVEPTGVDIKEQQKRWGSCTKNRELLYNWRIIMAPMSIVDYVVVHELCHLIEENHTDAFWRLLKSVISDYERRKEWLRVKGRLLKI